VSEWALVTDQHRGTPIRTILATRAFLEYDEGTPVPRVLNRPHPRAITWQVPFSSPKYGVFGDRLEGFDLFDKGKQTTVFLIVAHTSGSSNSYRIQEDL
jgi:hypothetical protein